MKDRRLRMARWILMASALPLHGCTCAHQRQSVYPNRGSKAVRVETRDGVRVQAPFVDIDVPVAPTRDDDRRLDDVPLLNP